MSSDNVWSVLDDGRGSLALNYKGGLSAVLGGGSDAVLILSFVGTQQAMAVAESAGAAELAEMVRPRFEASAELAALVEANEVFESGRQVVRRLERELTELLDRPQPSGRGEEGHLAALTERQSSERTLRSRIERAKTALCCLWDLCQQALQAAQRHLAQLVRVAEVECRFGVERAVELRRDELAAVAAAAVAELARALAARRWFNGVSGDVLLEACRHTLPQMPAQPSWYKPALVKDAAAADKAARAGAMAATVAMYGSKSIPAPVSARAAPVVQPAQAPDFPMAPRRSGVPSATLQGQIQCDYASSPAQSADADQADDTEPAGSSAGATQLPMSAHGTLDDSARAEDTAEVGPGDVSPGGSQGLTDAVAANIGQGGKKRTRK